MASLLPYLALAATRGLTGALAGQQQGAAVAEERRRRQVAEALQQAQVDRQARLDAVAEQERQRRQALEPIELAQRGIRQGAAPATPDVLPTGVLGPGMTTAPNLDAGRYVQAGDYYLDTQDTPEVRAAQRTLLQRAQDAAARMREAEIAAKERAAALAESARHNRAMEGVAGRQATAAERNAATRASQPPGGRPRTVPASAVTAMNENAYALRAIDDAIAQVAQTPDAVGLKNVGPLSGIRNHLSPALGGATDTDKGVRAAIGNLGSLTIHDRTGAAMSPREWDRLKAFVPTETDNASTALVKLRELRKRAAFMHQGLVDAYDGAAPAGTDAPSGGEVDPGAMRAPGAAVRGRPTGGTTGLLSAEDRARANDDPQFAAWLRAKGMLP